MLQQTLVLLCHLLSAYVFLTADAAADAASATAQTYTYAIRPVRESKPEGSDHSGEGRPG